MLKRFFMVCTAITVLILLSSEPCQADGALATGTPITYKVTLHKIETSKDGGNTWYTLGEGTMTFNIASVTAGAVVGAYVSNSSLPPGTYTKMRITVSRTFTLKGTVSYLGTTYYTSPSGITTDSGQYGEQSISVPEPPTPIAGLTFTATRIITEEDRSSSPFVLEEGVSKTMTIKFNVTDKLSLYSAGPSTYQFMPEPPTLTVSYN